MPRRQGYAFSPSDMYDAGYDDGYGDAMREMMRSNRNLPTKNRSSKRTQKPKPTRKLSAWQKYIKNKKNHIKLRSGKLNLKKMAVQFRKTKKK